MFDEKIRVAGDVPTPLTGREILWLSSAGWMRRLFGGTDVAVDKVAAAAVWAGAFNSGANFTVVPTLVDGRVSVRGDLVHLRGKVTGNIVAANTHTYCSFALPYVPAFAAGGWAMESQNARVGSCIVDATGVTIMFGTASTIATGACAIWFGATYQK